MRYATVHFQGFRWVNCFFFCSVVLFFQHCRIDIVFSYVHGCNLILHRRVQGYSVVYVSATCCNIDGFFFVAVSLTSLRFEWNSWVSSLSLIRWQKVHYAARFHSHNSLCKKKITRGRIGPSVIGNRFCLRNSSMTFQGVESFGSSLL